MKAYIDGAHAKNMKVKIYNTVRELSNSCTEIFALRSLNGEIFSKGKGRRIFLASGTLRSGLHRCLVCL